MSNEPHISDEHLKSLQESTGESNPENFIAFVRSRLDDVLDRHMAESFTDQQEKAEFQSYAENQLLKSDTVQHLLNEYQQLSRDQSHDPHSLIDDLTMKAHERGGGGGWGGGGGGGGGGSNVGGRPIFPSNPPGPHGGGSLEERAEDMVDKVKGWLRDWRK